MRASWTHRSIIAIAALAVALSALAPSTASATSRYAFANGCYRLYSQVDGKYVVKDTLGYRTIATYAGATPFRMQATALGRYLLYGPDARMPAAGLLNQVSSTATPGPAADWEVNLSGGGFRFTNHSTGQGLGRGGVLSRLVLVGAGAAAPFSIVQAPGCAQLPRDRGQRDGHSAQGIEPDGPGARLPRRPRSHQRVPVPRRPLPLRAPLEPLRRDGRAQGLRRPRAQRRARHVRELPRHRQPRRHPRHRRAGRRSRAGRATSP